jgi:hypothetical protein
MIAVDDRNCVALRPYAVRQLQVATAAGNGNPGAAASAQYAPAACAAPAASAPRCPLGLTRFSTQCKRLFSGVLRSCLPSYMTRTTWVSSSCMSTTAPPEAARFAFLYWHLSSGPGETPCWVLPAQVRAAYPQRRTSNANGLWWRVLASRIDTCHDISNR